MSGPENPLQTPQTAQAEVNAESHFEIASVVAARLPDEITYGLREDEFRILCDGEMSQARGGRDFCIGVGVTALLGLVSIFATLDWKTVWNEKRVLPFIACAVMLIIAAGCAAGWWIFRIRMRQSENNSPYSRLRTRIDGFFTNKAE